MRMTGSSRSFKRKKCKLLLKEINQIETIYSSLLPAGSIFENIQMWWHASVFKYELVVIIERDH